MYTVLIYSEKGGVGKSSLANTLAYGASLSNDDPAFAIAIAHMDNRRPIKAQDDRGYEIIDLRDDKQAVKVIENAKASTRDGILVIDVGANKTNLVERFANGCDLVLVPVEGDYDSLRLAQEALENPSLHGSTAGIYAVTNRTPAPKSAARKRFDEHISPIPADKVLYQFPQMSAVSDLGRPEPLRHQTRSRIRYQAVRFFNRVETQILRHR